MSVLSQAFDTPQEREDFFRQVIVGVVSGIVVFVLLKRVVK